MIVALRPSESRFIESDLTRTAGLVALESDDLEIVSLLLKVLGWQSLVATDFDGVLPARIGLLIMGASMMKEFLELRSELPAGLVSGVTVDHTEETLFEIAMQAKITCLMRPLDITELEGLVALAN